MKRELVTELAMTLTPAERLHLLGDLWDSLDSDDLPELTAEQIGDLERELAEHEADPGSAIPWEEVRGWLWSRRK